MRAWKQTTIAVLGGLSLTVFGALPLEAGTQEWAARYDGGMADYAEAIAVDGAGHVYVTGYTVVPEP